jgi:glycerol kinase
MADCVLALDQGTTSSRAILFGRDGRPIASAQEEFPQIYPQPGHVEHDPEAIWKSQLDVTKEALSRGRRNPTDVAALGITNQRETTVVWEKSTGKPVANAIVWQSRITAPICDRLKADGLEKTFCERTGLVVDAYFSGTKIAHLLETIPGLRSRAEKGEVLFGTIDSFLIWRLTGGKRHVTDYSNASRTLVYNIHKLDWDDELLRILKIPRAMLPEVKPSSAVYGETDRSLLGASLPIASDIGDQQAATFGQACFEPGAAKNTYGTGCFMLMNTGEKPVASKNGLITTIGWGLGGKIIYCLEGSVFIAGAVVQWLRDGLKMIAAAPDIEKLAASVSDAGGVFLVPAFVGLGAPHWNQGARGTIVGLTRGVTTAHIARAALDSMAYQTREVLDAMQQDSGTPLGVLKVDGGASVNNLLMQFQSDVLGVDVQRPVVQETTALGAAYLAGLAVGFWKDQEDVHRNWALERQFKPSLAADKREKLFAKWKKAVARSLDWEE